MASGSTQRATPPLAAFQALTPRERKALFREFQRHPTKFIEHVLGVHLWPKQQEIAQSCADNPRTSVRSCHASGKTFDAACIALWFLYSYPGSQVITTAPVFRQVRENLWGEMERAYTNAKFPLGKDQASWQQCRLSLGAKWKALGFATDKMERFSGFHGDYILVIVDEASGVKEETFDALEGIMSSGKLVRMLLLSQGTQTAGTFYDSFHGGRGLYHGMSIAAWDTPNFAPSVVEPWMAAGMPDDWTWPHRNLILPSWVERMRTKWGVGTPLWDVKVEGKFPPADPYAVIALGWAEDAAIRTLNVDDDSPAQIGVDVARTGMDLTVVCARRGPQVLALETQAITTGPQVEGMVIEMVARTGIKKIVFDADGVGGPVADYTRTNHKGEGWEVIDFHSAAAVKDKDTYYNAKAEAWIGVGDRFRTGDVDLTRLRPDVREDLIADLVSIRKEFTARGQVAIEPKDKLRERIGRSPDRADALMLAFVPAGSFGAWAKYLRDQLAAKPMPS